MANHARTGHTDDHSSDASRSLISRLSVTRQLSLDLASPLGPEDMTVQATEDASPTKWHLAHVTWFFETFLLTPHLAGYRVFDDAFSYCFNSYYEAVGARHPRPQRGLLTRPTCARVLAYRAHVDEALSRLLDRGPDDEVERLVETGIHHEQQHQELILTDILALFSSNPLRPAYRETSSGPSETPPPALDWIDYPGGIYAVGRNAAGEPNDTGFAWDNEGPRHRVLLAPFKLADRLVTNAEWLDFMDDGGYRTPSLWLADGWTLICRQNWQSPLYWEERDDAWHQMTLRGLRPVEPSAPVCHVSYFEAEAFARWAGKRLPTEFEWEIAALSADRGGNTLASGSLLPAPCPVVAGSGPRQMFGDVWEWTASAYLPYPGYRPPTGAIGEYNGKFMVAQHVLRGASCATPAGHSRPTYRNFFYPHQRWQFSGLRLATEV